VLVELLVEQDGSLRVEWTMAAGFVEYMHAVRTVGESTY